MSEPTPEEIATYKERQRCLDIVERNLEHCYSVEALVTDRALIPVSSLTSTITAIYNAIINNAAHDGDDIDP